MARFSSRRPRIRSCVDSCRADAQEILDRPAKRGALLGMYLVSRARDDDSDPPSQVTQSPIEIRLWERPALPACADHEGGTRNAREMCIDVESPRGLEIDRDRQVLGIELGESLDVFALH